MLGGRYNIPSRDYIQNNVMIPMYEETKVEIRKELKKHINIGLTTDAWTSMTQQSYITVTAHVITEQCELMSYVLSTAEISKRHTSVNLMEHIHGVLQDYEIATEHNIVCNFNAINLNDIHEQDQECDNEVILLNTDDDLPEVTLNVSEDIEYFSDSETQDINDFLVHHDNNNKMMIIILMIMIITMKMYLDNILHNQMTIKVNLIR